MNEPEFPPRELLLEKPLPSSPETEQASLAVVFLDNTLLAELIELARPELYYSRPNRNIYEAMIRLFELGEPIEPISVANKMRELGTLESSGGVLYLAKLQYGQPSVNSIKNYAKTIKGKFLLREVIHAANKAELDARSDPEDPSLVVDNSTKAFFAIASEEHRKGFVHIATPIDDVLTKSESLQGHGVLVTGLPTGFQDVDELTSGFQKQNLVIIGGVPSMGKTALALNIGMNAALRHGKIIGIFSLEMSEEEVAMRMVCTEARVDIKKFRAGMLSGQERQRLNVASIDILDARLFIDETPGVGSLEIRSKARRLQAEQGGLDGIIVDYLQLMSSERGRSREQEVSQLANDLKSIAKDLNVPVIAVAALSRASAARTDKRPILSDLRESGAIEYAADTVIFLYRDEYYNKMTEQQNIAEVIIAKQRNGPTDTKLLRWDRTITRFDPLSQIQEF